MRVNAEHATDGEWALRLTAAAHIACFRCPNASSRGPLGLSIPLDDASHGIMQ